MPSRITNRRLIMRRPVSTFTWTPASLPNLLAWYKADAGVYSDLGSTLATNGQKVMQWNDQSGNGYHVSQSDTNHLPTYQATSWTGGKKAVWLAATSGFGSTLISASGVAMGTGSAFSCFAMAQLESGSNSNGRALVYSATNADFQSGSGLLLSRDSTNQAIGTYRNGTVATNAITYATDTRMGFINDGTNTTPYVNNVAGTPVADTNAFTNSGYIAIGGAVNGGGSVAFNSYWQGKVAEIVLTKAALSSGDRASLDTYFTGRW